MKSIVIDCEACIMRATNTCDDCVVTHMFDTNRIDGVQTKGIVLDMAEHRAVRWFAEAGLVPTLRHRAAPNS